MGVLMAEKEGRAMTLGPCTAPGQPEVLGMEDPIILGMWMVTCQMWRATIKAQDVAATFSLPDGLSGAHTCIQEGRYHPLKTHDSPTPSSQWRTVLGWHIHHTPDTGLHNLPPNFLT